MRGSCSLCKHISKNVRMTTCGGSSVRRVRDLHLFDINASCRLLTSCVAGNATSACLQCNACWEDYQAGAELYVLIQQSRSARDQAFTCAGSVAQLQKQGRARDRRPCASAPCVPGLAIKLEPCQIVLAAQVVVSKFSASIDR
jgi:hypothetical protein